MKNIHIKTIPHHEQRYPSGDDYWTNPDRAVEIRVSDMKNNDYEFLTTLHAFIEWYLTEKRGIKEEDIKVFDEMYERERAEGLHTPHDQPGFDPRAPYLKEHTFVDAIEQQVAKELGVDWEKYGETFSKL